MKKVVIILGMHRSGTSVTAQLSQRMGAYLGEEKELISASPNNPNGHFENTEVVCINNDILQSCNKEWYSLGILSFNYNSLQVINAIEKIKFIIQRLLKEAI